MIETGSAPGQRRGSGRAAWLGTGVLTAWMGGCAFFQPDAVSVGLRQRILPPPELLSMPALPASRSPPAEQLPRPRVLSGLEDVSFSHVREETESPTDPSGLLTLDQAIDLALRLSPNLELMKARIAVAEGGKQVAFADFLPEVSGTLRHIEGDPNTLPFGLPTLPTYVGNVSPAPPADRFNRAELSVQWILWDFGRTPGKYGQATTAVEIAQLQYLRAQQTVAFNVTAAYLAVLQARATREVAEEAVRRAESVLRDARNFLKRGTAIRNDVLRADVLLAEMQLTLVKSRTAEAAAIAGLNQAIGINVTCPTQIIDLPEEPPFRLALGDCLQLAADYRDEFHVVVRAIRSARLGTGVAQADFLPRVLVGGTGMHEEAGRRENTQTFAGVSLELALFEGGRRVGRLQTAEAEVRAAIAQGKEICDRIAYEVNIAYLTIDDARQRIALSRTTVAQAAENLRVVRGLFEKGDATPTDIVDAELAITRAQQNYYTALYDYQTALARLEYAVGSVIRNQEPGVRSQESGIRDQEQPRSQVLPQ